MTLTLVAAVGGQYLVIVEGGGWMINATTRVAPEKGALQIAKNEREAGPAPRKVYRNVYRGPV